MRLLHIKLNKQVGATDAFLQLRAEGALEEYKELDYLGFANQVSWSKLPDKIFEMARAMQPDVIFFNNFHHASLPNVERIVFEIQKFSSSPLIFVSCGDPFSGSWMLPHYPAGFRSVVKLADVVFSSQMGRCADKIRQWGAKNVVFMPHGLCPRRFAFCLERYQHYSPEFDVVFVGSNIKARNPVSHYFHASRRRREMVDALARRYGKRFGLFGHGWGQYSCWQGPVPFEKQVDTFFRGQVVFGGAPHSNEDYYMSDRPFFAIGSGIPFVDFFVPRVDKVFRDGEHWYLVRDKASLLKTCDNLLDLDMQERIDRAGAAAEYVSSRHTLYHHMTWLVDVAYSLRTEGNGKGVSLSVPPFFLPEVDLEQELRYALR